MSAPDNVVPFPARRRAAPRPDALGSAAAQILIGISLALTADEGGMPVVPYSRDEKVMALLSANLALQMYGEPADRARSRAMIEGWRALGEIATAQAGTPATPNGAA